MSETAAPGAGTGEGWDEPGLPPGHGVWWLVSASGAPLPWAGTLSTTTVDGKKVLAESFMTGIGWVNFPVYTFSGDLSDYAVCSISASTRGRGSAAAWPHQTPAPAVKYLPKSITPLPAG